MVNNVKTVTTLRLKLGIFTPDMYDNSYYLVPVPLAEKVERATDKH